MKKRFFAAVLSALMIVSASSISLTANAVELTDEAVAAAADAETSAAVLSDIEVSESGDFSYRVRTDVNDGSIEISRYNGNSQSVLLPYMIDGKKVTAIGSNAFSNNTELKIIALPDSINSIGAYAFYKCTSLTKFSVPNSVTKISSDVFKGCTSLAEVNIPDSVTEIRDRCFQDCTSLKKITLPKNITIIYSELFKGCSSLTEVTVPDKVTRILAGAFKDCKSLKKVIIPASIKTVGTNLGIAKNVFANSPNVTIYGYLGSEAETYAKKYSIPFVALNSSSSLVKVGDADGDGEITASDALSILRSIVGLEKTNKNAADVDGDGQVTSNDALLILRYIVGYKDKSNIGKSA